MKVKEFGGARLRSPGEEREAGCGGERQVRTRQGAKELHLELPERPHVRGGRLTVDFGNWSTGR